jgi:hypothetical protein
MAKINPSDPQSANEYENRATEAVKSVLVEIGQILGSFHGKYAVIGGAVPWLLLDNHEMPHVGTLDVDLGLDAEALGEGEYARLVETLMGHDYKQSGELRKFQLVRTITPADGGNSIDVIVDFLMPRDAVIEENKPPILEDFAVQRADGADLALHFNEMVAVRAAMPNGGTNKVEIAVCSIPALLAMKDTRSTGATNKRIRTTSTTAYATIQEVLQGSPKIADRYSSTRAAREDTAL